MKFKTAPKTGHRATFAFLAIIFLSIVFKLHQGHQATQSPIITANKDASLYNQHFKRSASLVDVSLTGRPHNYSNSYNASTSKVAIPFGDAKVFPVEHGKRKDNGVDLTDAEWQACVNGGNNMLCLLDADIEGADKMLNTATQSYWLNIDDASFYGWSLFEQKASQYELEEFEPALEQLGISPDQLEWDSIHAVHADEYQQDGVMREVHQH